MRIRIQTYSPLPEVKAWFVPDAHNIPENIANLKDELCRRVQGLKNAQYHGRNLSLVLDGFELLDDSPFSAVRDGDLICVKQLSPPEVADVEMRVVHEEPHGQKRKRSHISKEPNALSAGKPTPLGLVTTSTKNRVVKPIPYESESESDSSSSSSSTSSTSSSSSSSSTSSSSTSSSSTSSTSSSSAASSPSKPLSPKKAIPNRSVIPQPTTTTIHVPPGLGKPSTHSRNKRRRQKREYLKSSVPPPAPTLKGASEVNSTPLGPPKPRPPTISPAAIPLPPSPPAVSSFTVQAAADASAGSTDGPPAPVYVTQDQVMMSGMRNKNKKKGFKLSMANPIPQKIVFDAQRPGTGATLPQPLQPAHAESPAAQMPTHIDGDGQPPAPTVASASASASTPSSVSLFNATGPAPHARLVPPSELQARGALPANMLVTSIDVEAGMWPAYAYSAGNNSARAKKSRGKKKKQRVSYGEEEEQYYGGDDAEAWGEGNEGEAAAVEVLLDYSGDGDGAGTGGTGAGGLGFDWDRAEKQWESAVPVVSADVLTPGVFVGWKALAINPRTFSPEVLLNVARVVEGPDAASGKGVLVRAVRRTADNDAAFAFGLNGTGGDGEEGEEVEETVAWSDVPGLEWRLLNI